MKKFLLSILLSLMLIPIFVNAKTCDTNKVTISSITVESKSESAKELDEATVSGKNINLNLSMSKVGDNIKYKIVVKNDSDDDYLIDKNSFNINSDYIEYTFESEDDNNLVKANSSRTIYLKINYASEVPDEAFESGTYNDNKLMLLNLATDDTIDVTDTLTNPSTGVQWYIIILLIILVISGTLYIILKKKQYIKFIVLIIGITIIIPISVYALCKCNISISTNVKIDKPIDCGSFSGDSWDVISYNVKNQNDSCYHVGDTKEVLLDGFGTHTLRIANKSTYTECSNEEFSQTTCGFVVEFADIISLHNMNSSNTNIGGWPESDMRSYISNDIYNALPSELKNIIVNTRVISGYSWMDSSNFTSIDKLYLLSFYEIYGTNSVLNFSGTEYDSTKQLDFYASINNLDLNLSETYKKYNNSVSGWWLRSPYTNNSGSFYGVYDCGYVEDGNSATNCGVSPAFRVE